MNSRQPIQFLAAARLAGTLAACVPAAQEAATPAASLAVSPTGDVAYAWHGQAFVARQPGYVPAVVPTPADVTSVAWRDGTAWLAVPSAGLVVAATGTPTTLTLPGQPALLTPGVILEADGTVYDYAGTRLTRLPGRASEATDLADGTTCALLGSTLYRIKAGAFTAADRLDGGHVYSDGTTCTLAATRTAATPEGPVSLRGNVLVGPHGEEPLDPGEKLMASGGGRVAVLDTETGRLRVLDPASLKFWEAGS
ncbi:MAG TPA: hypothetical protein VHN99_03510 [Deinococcales bacterium]|nr:hypothetical protein [Deinococcales bacterium]